MQGQANHFMNQAPEKIEYAVHRYQEEVRRLYGVMEHHLRNQSHCYLVGNKCTIADMACYGWIRNADRAGVKLDDFPKLREWKEKCDQREGFKKGREVPKEQM